jgi:hypothetical protein
MSSTGARSGRGTSKLYSALRPLDDGLSIRESGSLDRLDDEHREVHLRSSFSVSSSRTTRKFGSLGPV